MNILKESGAVTFMVRSIVRFFKHRYLCLLLLTIVMLIPGAITGSGAATVLTVGTLVGTVLTCMGISPNRTAAIIFLCAAMSAAAPPINLWAMMAAAGSNMPYVGFTKPLLVLSVVGALLSMFILGARGKQIDLESALAELPASPAGMNWVRVGLPFLVLAVLVAAGRIWPFQVPIMGLPLMFILAAITALLVSPQRLRVVEIASSTIHPHSLVGIMVVVGMLIQIMALSGAVV